MCAQKTAKIFIVNHEHYSTMLTDEMDRKKAVNHLAGLQVSKQIIVSRKSTMSAHQKDEEDEI